ncbi:MAG: sugar ABC transporter permease [Solobacterium sp.]|nr:sugar ABC transporter permease [Solobacterium sp.]MDY3794325.1 sugar ABC transporter permease [Erysipelotrichaceae bacterium]MCI6877259.1 sugar ABC transporter permease [Solobacterium sp.]MCI7156287.1 sugar ABC transporter permease [Solobacterium sp.]MDD5801325.1 sugar ABC transporter permease [Solobacterium sp.]
MKKKKKYVKRDPNALSSDLIVNPIKRKVWLFLIPTFVCFVIGFVWPFASGVYLSFCQFRLIREALFIPLDKVKDVWVGFSNYARAFADPSFKQAFIYTAKYAVVSVVVINVLSFFLGYLLTLKIKGSNIFRATFFMPNLIGGIVLSYIWQLIFNGVLIRYNTYLTANAKFGFWGLVILMAWQQIGYMMIIYIAGFQSVSEDILEAAKIDGANKWQSLFKVIVPNMMTTISICMFLSLTNSFKLFDQNLALTGGAPVVTTPAGQIKMTEMLALNISNSFGKINTWAKGTAQAKAVIFFILVAAISLLQLKFTRSKEVQQ